MDLEIFHLQTIQKESQLSPALIKTLPYINGGDIASHSRMKGELASIEQS